MKKIIFIALLIIGKLSLDVNSQSYTIQSIPYEYLNISGQQLFGLSDDNYSNTIPIGFTFYFFEQPYNQIIIGSNGIVSFQAANAGSVCQWTAISIPSTSSSVPKNCIMAPWTDLNITTCGTTCSIRYDLIGNIPQRKFIVEFNSLPHYTCGSAAIVKSQVILHESTNQIQINIFKKDVCLQWNNGLSTLGLHNQQGTLSAVVPGRNASVWAVNQESWLFTPTFNPPQLPASYFSGKVFQKNDECFYVNQPVLHNQQVNMQLPNGSIVTTYTNFNGNYYFASLDTGLHIITHVPSNPAIFYTACPANGEFSLNVQQFNTVFQNLDFADTMYHWCSDLSTSLFIQNSPWPFSPNGLQSCASANLFAFCKNNGNVTDTASLIITLNDSTQLVNANHPSIYLGNNQYLFDDIIINPGQTVPINLQLQLGCETGPATYCYEAEISGVVSDCGLYSNHSGICRIIQVPYDPNKIQVASYNSNHFLFQDTLAIQPQSKLNYRINFQNTGNGPAQDVIIRIPTDSKINRNSILPTYATHNYYWYLTHDTLVFYFDEIWLPDSNTSEPLSHGMIEFSVDQILGNLPGDTIYHQAAIYFDYMPPVLTNLSKAYIPFESFTVIEFQNQAMRLYPNPTSSGFYLKGVQNAELIIYDMYGNLKGTFSNVSDEFIPVDSLNHGVYLIYIKLGNSFFVSKLIKQ